jgi:hypothetical protein
MLSLAALGGRLCDPATAQPWKRTRAPVTSWSQLVSSADGTKLVAASGGGIYTSTNSGTNWTLASVSIVPSSLASSADGRKLVAVVSGGLNFSSPIYTSTNSGGTWRSNNAPVANWFLVASSAGGTKEVAVVYGGGIYTTQVPTSVPTLGIQLTSTNTLLLSWPAASTGFVLQQNSALGTSNWLSVSNSINTVSGQNQVLVAPAGRESAFRLKSP